jgi:hypothetical protein
MNWPKSIKEPRNGWKLEFGVLIAPDGEKYGPDDALTPEQVREVREARSMEGVYKRIKDGSLPSFGFKYTLVKAADAVKGYELTGRFKRTEQIDWERADRRLI